MRAVRTGHCGESGFDFTVAAADHSGVSASIRRRGLGADEVRDAVRRLREPGDAGPVEIRPDPLPQHRLGREHIRRTTGVRVVAPRPPRPRPPCVPSGRAWHSGSRAGAAPSWVRWLWTRDWPASDDELVALQGRLAAAADIAVEFDSWSLPASALVGGCFVAFARGEAGPGRPGDRAWAAAVVLRVDDRARQDERPSDHHLRGASGDNRPRRADDVVAQAVAAQRVAAAYTPGLLARREGPILATAVTALDTTPDVLLVDATGVDHPRRAGLAVHLGAVTGIPTVGVTQQPLVASGPLPEFRRGATAPLTLDGQRVGYWVCTHTGARPVVAHAGWRTTPETAARTVIAASTGAARTPVPLQEARRVAREARDLAGAH